MPPPNAYSRGRKRGIDNPTSDRRIYRRGGRIGRRQAALSGVQSSATAAKEMGMQQAHISALETRHADIEARILEETQRPLPDTATLARLKKEKLRVKEEIVGLH
jgi:hypothetical protein